MSIARRFLQLTRYTRAARFWLFLILAALAFFGCNEARAACVQQGGSFSYTCDYRDEAYAKAQEVTPGAAGTPGWGCNSSRGGIGSPPHVITDYANGYSVSTKCGNPSYTGNNFSIITYSFTCPAGEDWNAETNTCDEDCAARPDRNWNPGQVGILNGSTTCDNGCLGTIFNNAGGSGFIVTYAGGLQCTPPPFPQGCEQAQLNLGWRNSTVVAGVCVPPTQSCPDGTARDPTTGECGNDACPSGMSLNPQGQCEPQGDNCPAGQTRAPDGSCQPDNDNCPAGQVKGPDGTCKPDGNGDGEPDDDVPDSFSGGESCDTPPACSGDVILCGQARIQWRIDCNTRKDTKVNGGACNAIPACIGKNCDALEYAQLLQQWRSSCALERLASGSPVAGDGGQPAWTKVDGMSQDPGAGQTAGDTAGVDERNFSVDDIDQSGWGGGGSACPALMVGGGTGMASGFAATLASPPAFFCDGMGWIKWILISAAAIGCCFWMARGGA